MYKIGDPRGVLLKRIFYKPSALVDMINKEIIIRIIT